MFKRNLLAPVFLLAAVAVVSAASAEQQNGTIEGVVIKLGSTEPLPGTRVGVYVEPVDIPTRSVTATGDGRFVLSDIPPGVYRLIATRDDGFLAGEYRQARPDTRGLPITVNAGQTLRDIQLTLAPPAAISGRVLDVDREPIGHAQVLAFRTYYRAGQQQSTIAQSVQTNDLGEFRLFWLAPGRYTVAAVPRDLDGRVVQAYIRPPGEISIHQQISAPVIRPRLLDDGREVEEVYLPVYFPGTLDSNQATPFTIRPGDDLRGIDINLVDMPDARRISGMVIDGATGQPAATGSVRAFRKDTGPNVGYATGSVGPNGRFEIRGVTQGAYYLFSNVAERSSFIAGGRSGRAEIEIGAEDIDNMTLVVPPAFSISGRFIIEGEHDIDITRLRASLTRVPDIFGMPMTGESSPAGTPDPRQPSADGTFSLRGIGVGDYQFGISYTQMPFTGQGFTIPESVYLKSIAFGGQEVLGRVVPIDSQPEEYLEITLATGSASITGSVVNDVRDVVPNVVVVLAPEAGLRSRIDLYRATAADASGRFDLTGIPPGEYRVFAWEEVENGAWTDMEFLRGIEARGTVVRLAAGATETIQVTVIRSGR